MKKRIIDYILKPVCSLFLPLLFFNSCNGQEKAQLSHGSKNSSEKNFNGMPQMIKTQKSDEYQDISCGLEDKEGNLWFGTSGEGVYRYDGQSFTQFTVQNGLSSNSVRSILEDKTGNIWIGTNKGLCCYDGKTIKQFSIGTNSTNLSKYSASANVVEVSSIMQDRKGVLWFGTSDGVVRFDGKNFMNFLDNRTIVNDSSLSLKNVQCIFEDKRGNIWFGSGPMAFEGLCLFDGISLTKFKPKNQVWVRKIAEDKDDRLLITTRGAGIVTYDGTNFSTIIKPIELRNDLLTYFLTDRFGNSWYASDYVDDNDIRTGGLWRYDGKSFSEFTKETGLGNTSVTFILEDRKGSIWVGTRNDGLYRYDGKMFINFSNNEMPGSDSSPAK